jgi:hypothetical protein
MGWWDGDNERVNVDIKDILFGRPGEVDEYAQTLFWEGVVGKDSGSYHELVDYVWEEYGIDFEEAFEWADYRDWYEAA